MNYQDQKFSFKIALYITMILIMEFMVVSQSNGRPALLVGVLQLGVFLSSWKSIKNSITTFFHKRSVYYLGLIILFSMLLFFSLNFSDLKTASFRAIFLFIVPSVMLIVMTMSDLNKEYTFKLIAKILMWFGFAISLYGIIITIFGQISHNTQYIEVLDIRFSQIVMGPNRDRISSITSNPNVLGSLLMITIPISFYVSLAEKSKLLLIVLFAQVYALLMTQSRASVIGLVVIAVIYLYQSSTRKMKFYYTSFIIMVIGLIIFLLYGEAALGRLADGLNGREEQWLPLIESIIQYPLSGVGFGMADVTIITRETHNVYLSIVAETGVFGLLLFLLIWSFGLKSSYSKLKGNLITKEKKKQLVVIFSILCGLIIHQLFETDLLQYDFITLFWLYLVSYSIQPKQHQFKNDQITHDMITIT